TPKNARLVFAALRDFGAPLTKLTAADFAREGFFYQMGRPPARVDILMSIQGVRFPKAWSRRVATDFDGVPGHVISRADLVANKRAVGRPQDLVDLANLVASDQPLDKPPEEPRKHKSKRRNPDRGAGS